MYYKLKELEQTISTIQHMVSNDLHVFEM